MNRYQTAYGLRQTLAGANGRLGNYMNGGASMQTEIPKFDVHAAHRGCLVVTCHGGLSWEDRELLANHLREHMRAMGQVMGVVMDVSRITYINSAGLGALFQVLRSVREAGAELVFVNVAPQILRLFRVVGLDRATRVAGSREEAFAIISQHPCNAPQADL